MRASNSESVFFSALLGSLLAVLVILADPAGAEAQQPDYVFTVPVDASDIHDNVARIGVYCVIKDSTATSSASYNVLGQGRTDVALTSREFNDTLTVEVNLDGDHYPAEAQGWRCTIVFQNTGETAWTSPTISASGDPTRRDVRGSPRRFERHGTF